MSLIDTARDALKDLPVSDIVRERLSLALDRLSDAESKIEALQAEKGSLHGQLERERTDHQKTQQELQALRDTWREEIRIHRGIEFRHGNRTADEWAAFCPKCHMPGSNFEGNLDVSCSDGACKWHVRLNNVPLSQVIEEL
jgi:hypothetical protein